MRGSSLVFPKDFLWGISMAAFQYEMGFSRESVDPNSDWYVWLHDKTNIERGMVSGDLPENGPGYWDLFRRDHSLGKWLGLNAWRLNPEWSRIFPSSTKEVKVYINEDEEGVKHVEIGEKALQELDRLANRSAVKRYREIFLDIKGRDMKLVLNLYHWPLPLWLHDPIAVRDSNAAKGPRGWVDKESVVEFAKYAAYIAWKFGDLVDLWSTFNEPNVVWTSGYMMGRFPPGIRNREALGKAAINMVQAHARAYDQIKEVSGKDARVGVIYAVSPAEPLEPSHLSAAERANYLYNLWFFEAIVNGLLDVHIGKEEGAVKREDLKDRADWIGVNYYTRTVVRDREEWPGFEIVQGYGHDCEPSSFSAANRPTSELGWEIYPEGLRAAVNLYKRYGRPIAVTENGIADSKDRHRPWFLVSNLYHLHKAMKEDGANVFGYLHWSLIDNLEWASGFSMRFGLFYVNMETKERTPRPSAFIYRHIIENNGIPDYLIEYARIPNFFIK